MTAIPENGAFELLEARHIDALTEAVRAATTSQAIANELAKKQTVAIDKLTQAVNMMTAALSNRPSGEDAASDVALDEATAEVVAVARTSSRDLKG